MSRLLDRAACVILGHAPDNGEFDLSDGHNINLIYHCERCGTELDPEDYYE
jgi:hypothetical protein